MASINSSGRISTKAENSWCGCGRVPPPSNIDTENFPSVVICEIQSSRVSPTFTGIRGPCSRIWLAFNVALSSPSSHVKLKVPSSFTLSTVAEYHSCSSSYKASTRSPSSNAGAPLGRSTCFIRETCNKPSRTAPTSTKAPKSRTLLTMPFVFWPTSSSLSSIFGAIFIMTSGLQVYSSPSSSQTRRKVPSSLIFWMIPVYIFPSSSYNASTASPGRKGPSRSTSEIFLRTYPGVKSCSVSSSTQETLKDLSPKSLRTFAAYHWLSSLDKASISSPTSNIGPPIFVAAFLMGAAFFGSFLSAASTADVFASTSCSSLSSSS
mmetsp:Transcript_94206/g.270087  ORF Transcript_94206/g.270087 Transcript_94206/m.270087 type:complete len:321 (+) Transcript_94206:343-1305(+)